MDLRLTFSDVYNKVISQFGLASTGDDLTLAKDLAVQGYRNFLYATNPVTNTNHTWSWLIKAGHLQLESGKWVYPLPSDFGRMHTPLMYTSENQYPRLVRVPASQIHMLRMWDTTYSYPTCFATTPETFDVDSGQSKELLVSPTPGGTYSMVYQYIMNPPKPENAGDYFVGDAGISMAIMQCALAVAEQQLDKKAGIQTQLAQQAIQRMINSDQPEAAETVGYVRDGNIPMTGNEYLKELTRKQGTYNFYV